MIGLERSSLIRSAALLVIAAVVPLLLFAATYGGMAYRGRKEDLRDKAIADARRLSEGVDRTLAGALDDAQDLAEMPALDEPADIKAFATVARREQLRHPLWSTAGLLTAKGDLVVNTAMPQDLGPAHDFASVQEMLAAPRPLLGNAVRLGDHYHLPVRAPVFRGGPLRFIVTVVVEPDRIYGARNPARLPSGWAAEVVDPQGYVVARSDGQAIARDERAGPPTQPGRPSLLSGVYRGFTRTGKDAVIAYWTSPVTGWSVQVAAPTADLDAPLAQMAQMIVLGAVLCLLLAAIFMALLMRESAMRRSESAALAQTQRMEALGRLTGGVAHDFNNLLLIIQGNTDLLRRKAEDPTIERPLTAIRIATERAARLTSELLVFARGGAANTARLDLNGAVRNCVAAIQEAAGPAVTVELALDSSEPAVEADRVQLEMALLNLAVNAREAMAGSGVVTISTRADGMTIELAVRDTGPGFAPTHLSQAFDPFFTTKRTAGAGLGLAQVYSFSRQSGGAVRIDNRRGYGAAIVITLPRAAPSDPVEAPPQADACAWETLRGRRVLLVDDNEAVRRLTADGLRERAMVVAEAANAQAALELLRTESFDALVSDIVMPGGMDGMALAAMVAKTWPLVRIILVSGYSASAAEARARGRAVVVKPFELSALVKQLAEALATEAVLGAA